MAVLKPANRREVRIPIIFPVLRTLYRQHAISRIFATLADSPLGEHGLLARAPSSDQHDIEPETAPSHWPDASRMVHDASMLLTIGQKSIQIDHFQLVALLREFLIIRYDAFAAGV